MIENTLKPDMHILALHLGIYGCFLAEDAARQEVAGVKFCVRPQTAVQALV